MGPTKAYKNSLPPSSGFFSTKAKRSERENAIRDQRKEAAMGKVPIRMKAVVYSLSPFQQKVMTGLWKDLPGKIHHKVSENWLNTLLLVGPVLGTYTYVQNYKEKEKLEHRY